MKFSRTRRETYNLGNFENRVVEATAETEVHENPSLIDVETVSAQLDNMLDVMLAGELQLVAQLTVNKDSAIKVHPLVKKEKVNT